MQVAGKLTRLVIHLALVQHDIATRTLMTNHTQRPAFASHIITMAIRPRVGWCLDVFKLHSAPM